MGRSPASSKLTAKNTTSWQRSGPEVCHVEDVGHLGLRVGSAAKLEEKEKFLKLVDSHSRECFCASIIIILFKVAIYWKAMHLPSSSVLKQTSAHFVIQPTMFQKK